MATGVGCGSLALCVLFALVGAGITFHGLGLKRGVGGRLCRPEKRLRKCSKRAIIPVLVQYQPTVP